MHASLCLSLFD